MSISTARRAGRRLGGKRGLARIAGVFAFVSLALAVAAPAWATVSATATLAPVGSGSYLVTVTNTGSETITGFLVIPKGLVVTSIVPSPACQYNGTALRWISCGITIAPAASTQMCYTGYGLAESAPLWRVEGGTAFGYSSMTPSPAVPSCPLPGFTAWSGGIPETTITPGSSSTPGSSGTAGSSSTPGSTGIPVTSAKRARPWSHAQCKGTYNAWIKKHHHVTRSQRKAEADKLHKAHGCLLSILK
jgi:hypothetical protein